jgi:hypothetical protein
MKILTTLFSILVLGAGLAAAHHGWTGYDESKAATFSGAIQEVTYENPHGTLKLDVDKKQWDIILAPPARMDARGLSREHLKTGAKVTVVGYVHRQTPNELRAERIIIDGKTFELR